MEIGIKKAVSNITFHFFPSFGRNRSTRKGEEAKLNLTGLEVSNQVIWGEIRMKTKGEGNRMDNIVGIFCRLRNQIEHILNIFP